MNAAKAIAILSERRARSLQSRDPSVYPDGTITRYWPNIPREDLDDCILFLERSTSAKNGDKAQAFVDDPMVGAKKRSGRWRNVFVDTRQEQDQSYTILQTLAEGLRTTVLNSATPPTIDFSGCRLVNDKKLLGNSSSVTGISNTTSHDPERYLLVRFTAISPDHTSAIMAQIGEATYTAPRIRGEEYAGEWSNIYATSQLAEDGSRTIDLLLARPQFTLNAYRDFGGSAETGLTYLWNVPKNLAQTIMDAWKTGVGKSAIPTFSKDGGLVDIVLSGKTGIPENLTISGIGINCNTTATYHFAWGYTEAQVGTFVSAHSTQSAGLSRTVRTDTRGDGYYDVTIEERTFGPHTGSLVDFSIVIPTGTKITETQYYGYNLRTTELANIRAAITADATAVGKSVAFKITREDDCSHDFEAVVRLVTQIDQVLIIPKGSSQGVGKEIRVSTHATTGALPAGVTSEALPRQRIRAQLDAKDDETVQVIVERDTVQEVTNTHSIPSATAGIGIPQVLYSGKNADAANIAAALTNIATRESVTLVISPNDDKTFDYSILKRTVQAPQGEVDAAIAEQGIGRKIKAGKNVTSTELADAMTAFASGARKQVNFNLVPQDDGLFDYVAEETTVQRVVKTDIVRGSKHRIVTKQIGRNADEADIPVVTNPPPAGTTVNARVDAKDDKTFDFDHETETVTEKTAQSRIYTEKQERVIDRTQNAAAQDTSVAEDGKIVRVQQQENDDGFFDIEKEVVTPVATNSAPIRLYTDGLVTRTLTLYFNQDTAPTAAAGEEIISPEFNDFGKYDYIKITTAITAGSNQAIIVWQAVTQEERSPIRSRFNSGVLEVYEMVRYRDVTQKITRTYSLTASNPSAPSSSKTGSQQFRAGYDDKRGVYFIDADVKTFSAWYGELLIKLPPLSV